MVKLLQKNVAHKRCQFLPDFFSSSSPKKNVWRRLRDPQSPGGAGHKQQGVRWWSGDDGGGVFKWNFVNTHRPINQKPSKNHAAMVHRKKPLVQPEIIATHGDMDGRKLFFLLDFQGHYHLWIFLFDSNESKTIPQIIGHSKPTWVWLWIYPPGN